VPEASKPGVLILIKGLGIGGAERLIIESARFWDRGRFHYQVAYLLPWKNQLVPDLLELSTPVRCLGGARGMTPALPVRLRRLILQSQAKLIHAHLPLTGILARLTSPVPVIYTEHNLADSYRAPTRLANRLTYPRNRAVIAVSEAVARSVSSYGGPSPFVIPNGVAPAVMPTEAKAAREELELAEDAPLVVHVGNIRPHKGHETLLATSAILKARHPEVTIVSIGGEKFPGDLERLRSRAKRAGLDQTVRFLGRRTDALAFLAAADVVVNPADVEGLPVAVLEAMALGRPVVATAVGGVPRLIEDQVTGSLVPPGDPPALALAVERLLDDPGLASSLGLKAKALVQEHYGIESMVRAIEDVYGSVLDE
jgi:glycosyltransferase involved in cell wall biosynthesis